MSTLDYHRKTITVQAPPDADPADLLAIRRYLADGWLISGTERQGAALSVALVRAYEPPAELPEVQP